MKSKMTEREFVRAVDEKAGSGWSKRISDLVLPIVREAGLEFAPEPMRIPTCIDVSDSGKIVDASVNALLSRAELTEICKRAMAYPRLRAECEELVEKVQSFIGKAPVVLAEKLMPTREAVANLEDVLEKGPKS